MDELMQVVQLPVIQERLRSIKDEVQQRLSQAVELVCTPETLPSVKKVRAQLNAEYKNFELECKRVEATAMAPIESFRTTYRDCVSLPYKAADTALKAKINAVEDAIKEKCEAELQEYFGELCVAHCTEWLRFEQADLKIGLTQARQKDHKNLREFLTDFVSDVADTVAYIYSLPDAEEIMLEYKRTLNLAQAVGIVQQRKHDIGIEKQAKEIWEKKRKQEEESIRRVEAVTPPILTEPEGAAETMQADPILCASFTVHSTKAKLLRLRNFLQQEEIKYDC